MRPTAFQNHRHILAALLFVLSLLVNMAVWSGASLVPGVGKAIASAIQREAPVRATYARWGTALSEYVPLNRWGAPVIAATYQPAFERIRSGPQFAMAFMDDLPYALGRSLLEMNVWLTPLLLILTALAVWARPEQIVAFGGRK